MQASSFSHFLELAPELREMIYRYAFVPSTSPPDIDVLNERVPHSSALRQTSKFILRETGLIYDRANKYFDNKRKEIQADIIQGIEAFVPENAVLSPRATNIVKLARSMREPSTCSHSKACSPQLNGGQCYFCASHAHHQCLHCGKHLTIALYAHLQGLLSHPELNFAKQPRMQPTSFKPPLLVLPSYTPARERFTSLGCVILKHPDRPRTSLFPVRNPATVVFNYYALEMRRQRAIELRCWIRKAAINKFWATKDERVFSERTIGQIEAKDKRMALVQSAEALWPKHEKMEWRGEFLRRTQLEASMTKTHISWLVPA